MDYGFEACGFQTKLAIEADRNCCETLRLNKPKCQVIESPIELVSNSDIAEFCSGDLKEVDLLAGGPPCQPFSKSGYWSKGDTKRLADPRAKTLEHFMRLVEITKPKVFILENVAGMSYSGKDEGIKYLLESIEQINRKTGMKYVPCCKILKMVEFGVPQLRERFFLVAEREGREFEFPIETHLHPNDIDKQKTLFGKKQNPKTAWEAIGHLDQPVNEQLVVGGKWGDLLPSIPEGENYLWHTDRKGGKPIFGWRTRYWGFLLKLAKSHPSWTIQAQPGSSIGPFHWDNRKLSTQELLKLMTFPEIKIFGGRTAVQRQLGNAVPSLMTEILGTEIRRQFFGGKRKIKFSLMPRTAESPKPRRPRPVPSKYKEFYGDHPAHPGTGKGPMALSRPASSAK